MLLEENRAPAPHHITIIIGGVTEAALEIDFGLALILKLTKCSGKARRLKSLTYLQPSEYACDPDRYCLFLVSNH
jgi:hypothetical protein